MNETEPWREIADHIGHAVGRACRIDRVQSVGGGCINDAYTLHCDQASYFAKLNAEKFAPMFVTEQQGLMALAGTGAVCVPIPVCQGVAAGRAFLILEYLALSPGGSAAAARLGEQLAALHRITAPAYGGPCDNTLGTTPQPNAWCPDWVVFWRQQRLGHQLMLVRGKSTRQLQQQGEALLEALPAFFRSYTPAPALLHGDLWGGNWGCLPDGAPVVFDPAVYYGDRETDLAMTTLFGGFPAQFYQAYQAHYPLDPGYPVRCDLYNLYHVLNHLNLFGGGYELQAQVLMGRLLSEVR